MVHVRHDTSNSFYVSVALLTTPYSQTDAHRSVFCKMPEKFEGQAKPIKSASAVHDSISETVDAVFCEIFQPNFEWRVPWSQLCSWQGSVFN